MTSLSLSECIGFGKTTRSNGEYQSLTSSPMCKSGLPHKFACPPRHEGTAGRIHIHTQLQYRSQLKLNSRSPPVGLAEIWRLSMPCYNSDHNISTSFGLCCQACARQGSVYGCRTLDAREYSPRRSYAYIVSISRYSTFCLHNADSAIGNSRHKY